MPRSSPFLGHEPCPKCRAEGKDRDGNNMGRWEDGHGYCFAGHRTVYKADNITLLEQVTAMHHREATTPKVLQLPADCQSTIGHRALTWLAQYGIMLDEIKENEILWSDFRDQLLFPFRDSTGHLMAYQARCFRPPIGQAFTKWINYGDLGDLTHIIEKEEWTKGPDTFLYSPATLVIVEDIVSAIKVGRQRRTMPLFGSSLSLRRALRLRYLANNIIFWLDADKFKESVDFSKQLQMYGIECRSIFTEKDPKTYSDEQINDFLR